MPSVKQLQHDPDPLPPFPESGDSILQSELEALRGGPDYFEVWDDDDFEPIADRFKKVISLSHGSPL